MTIWTRIKTILSRIWNSPVEDMGTGTEARLTDEQVRKLLMREQYENECG